MGLSRLENFLRSFRGNIIYVDPNALDSTDSIENDGTSAARPLKTIQRALIEAARFSHLPGLNNDKFANTTILIYPGEHLIDNRPGWIPELFENPDGSLDATKPQFRLRSDQISTDFFPFDASTNFDITSDSNVLYKFNSVYGGVIVPRGTSIVGMDLRKTKIRPKYIPDPKNDTVDRSAIFRLTGSCYLWQFSIFDGNPNGQVFFNYGQSKTVPNFSHHKLTVFEYADGVNNVEIDDLYIQKSYTSTDLDMYYQKIGLAYGPPAREIKNDFPSENIDIQAKLDEFRIVGSRGFEVNIANIYCGDGNTASSVAKVVLESPISGLDVDTAIRIDGVSQPEFNGQFTVKSVIDATTIEYNLSTTPLTAQGGTIGTLNLVVDTVSSASPYVFNCSLRSVYGMCGLHADGSKADGFKSMVVAQYTGISLQKDNNAFIKYNQETASYNSINVENIATDSLARYKPEYQNYHIKASNNAFIQCVSVFAIGFAQHFLSQSGGDQSITNSNSNFGAVSLSASGYQDSAFLRDDVGYITHIIPPREIEGQSISVEYDQIDISLTGNVPNPASPNRLYFYNRTDLFNPPKTVIDGYRIGAKINDKLNVIISEVQYSSDIIMQPNPNYTGTQAVSYQKTSLVQRNGSVNTISSNIITLDSQHNFINGESVRVISKNGNLPEGIVPGRIYYIITSSQDQSLTNSTIKLASSLNDALNATEIPIYNTPSSELTIVSRVSDKKCGDIGHPIQFDTENNRNQWYINVNPLTNDIYNAILPLLPLGTEISTARTFLTRILSNRVSEDSIYKLRYVIPKDSSLRARPPSEGYVIQESSSTITGEDEILTQFSIDPQELSELYGPTELRNLRLISDASWSSNIATINTEIPHNLSVGSKVQIVNIISSSNGALTGVGNTTGIGNSGFNGIFNVTSLPSSKSFRYSLPTNPGIFVDTTSTRSKSSPHYTRKNLPGTYLVYRSDKIQEYLQGKQDGVYHLIVTNSSNSPDVQPFTEYKFSQPIQNLYPQVDRDNPKSDPNASICYASPSTIGEVIINDPENSITKETLDDCFKDYRIDFGLSDIRSTTGIAHSLFTSVDHGLNPITTLNITSPGSNYGYGDNISQSLYNANLLPTNSRGEGATAVVKITSSGSISEIQIMNGGSNYAVNDVLTVVGVATTAGWVPATVTVSSIYNHIGETLQITGTTIDSYNQLYNITAIPSSRVLQVDSSSTINPPTSILGSTRVANSNVSLTGNSFLVTHTASADVTTCTTTGSRSHGLQAGDKITFRRSDNQNLGNYIVRTVVSLTSFTIGENIGDGTSRVLPYKYSSTGGLISRSTESESARLVANYAGITTTLASPITVNDPEIVVPNLLNTGIKIGDYLEIDNEIVKVRQTVVGGSNPLIVFRGVLGTKKDTHESGAIVRKISPIPIELRRNSILRASGHTFEYLGYGSGNYSTAFPDRQDRQLSTQEELLSQSFKSDGGSSIFTGMNSDGDFYVGNKRVSSATGREEVFDSPIPTSRGEEISDETSLDITTTSELNVSRRIRVDGGQENNIISEFGGPTIFNEKVTVNNDIESNSLYLQGDLLISNKYTVSYQEPIIIGTPGDITYYSKPTQDGGYAGWMYTIENQWRAFGPIQNELDRYVGIWSGRIIPSAGTGDNGIVWDSNPGGGTGDFAFIQYYVDGIGENTRLHIGIRNDANDDIYLEATQTSTSGNLTVLSTVDSVDKNTGALIVDGGVGIEKNLTADSININTSGITQGNLGSNGGIDGIFDILNTTDSGTTVFQNKDSVGNYNDILTLANSSATIDGNLTVTENGLVKFNNVTESSDKDTGSLVVEGGVGIEKNTNIGGTLGVTGATTLNNNVTLVGSNSVATEYFKIQNGSAVDKFTVDSSSGDTSISGNLTVTGNVTANANSTLGDASTDTLTVNATSTFNSSVTLAPSQNLTVGGNLTVTGNVTVDGTTTTINSTILTVDDKNIELASTASPTDALADGGGIILKGTTDKTLIWDIINSAWTSSEHFNLASGKEYRIDNTAVIDSTRNILNIVNHTMTGNITVNTDKFTVEGATGNTVIGGTLDVTGATTLSSTLDVTGTATVDSNIILSNPNTSISWATANSDYAFIRFNSTSDSAPPSQLEIAIGDNGDNIGFADNIVVNQYGTSGLISRTLSLLDSSGNTGVPGDLNLSGSLNINTTRFNVNGITGNTTIGGALTVTSTSGVTAARFVKNGATATNFLKAGGADAALTGVEVTEALGYIPANAANAGGGGAGGFAQGNSSICDQLSDLQGVPRSFNGTPTGGNTDFTLRIDTNEFIPVGGSANLIVSLGGIIQRPGTDFIIVESPPGTNTSTIRFTTAPPAGITHFIVALGGQGSLTSNVDWNTKGQIPVAIADNNAILVNVGSDNTVLTADSTATAGVAWKTISNGVTPIGGIIMWSGTVVEAQALIGWAICDGNNGTPNLTNRFIVASHNGFGSGTVPTAGPGFNPANGSLTSDYTPGSVGGETAHQLTIAELASHNHGVPDGNQNAGFGGGTFDTGDRAPIQYIPTTYTGGNQFHENRPLYYGLAFIMRIA